MVSASDHNSGASTAMRVRTMKELGAAIKARRKALGLDQAGLAATVGVSREWIIDIEKGKPRAEAALVLRTLDALGLALNLEAEGPARATAPSRLKVPRIDIDRIVALA